MNLKGCVVRVLVAVLVALSVGCTTTGPISQDALDADVSLLVDVVYDQVEGDTPTDTGRDVEGADSSGDMGLDIQDAGADASDNGMDSGIDVVVDQGGGDAVFDVTDDTGADDVQADAGRDTQVSDPGAEDTDEDVTTGGLVLDPDVAEMSFGNVLPGCSGTPQTLRLLNPGEELIVLTGIWFETESPAIQVNGLPASFPHTLAGGEELDLQFSFAPATAGTYETTICVSYEGMPEDIPVCVVLSGTAADCGPGTHKCSCECADDSSVETCGTRCSPCTTAVSGAAPACVKSGSVWQCSFACLDGYHQCGGSCKSDIDPNACGSSCTLCYSQANADRACRDGQCAFDCRDGWGDCDGIYSTGCEESLLTNENCGGCDVACTSAPSHGVPACADTGCSFECLSGYHADGNRCEVNNVDWCCGDDGVGGTCRDCAFMQTPMPPHTTGICVGLIDFSCQLVCEPGWMSTTGGVNDGCECHFVSDFDQPGNGVDEDCDGSDGRTDLAWYVSTTGSDLADGSATAPFRTIQKAVDSAEGAFIRKHVYIAAGVYEENVTVVGPVSLIGGFSTDGAWTYSETNVTTIVAMGKVAGRTIAIDAVDVSQEAWFASLTLVAGAEVQTSDGVDEYGVKCSKCPGLGLYRLDVSVGPGGNVTEVPVGANGANGGNGGAGSYVGMPGAGGVSACGREGGAGGMGGSISSGYAGDPGNIVGEGGGAGGAGGVSTWAGDGGNGAGCTVSGQDRGGAQTVGSVVSGYWLGTAGTTGEAGCSGHGGGGGGGGRGYYGEYPEYGGGGGGGGAGGCAGAGGPGGKAGGASLGVLLDQSTGARIENCVISTSDAGDGGVGGTGGTGGTGGLGGPWTNGESGYYSGEGGIGGQGTNGGKGGGGAGGVSYAVYLSDTVLILPGNNTLSNGEPGVGGSTSGIKNAVDGVSGLFNSP